MSPLLARLLAHMPMIAKREALLLLFRATAAAFQADMPPLAGLSWEQCLLAYAQFTAQEADAALRRNDDLAALQERLYRNAYQLGRTPGRLLGCHGVDDVMVLGRILYAVLDVDFQGSDCGNGSGNNWGEITISRCYFSAFYSPATCRLMSAMDRGLLAGLAGGGELVITERITEGWPCCHACFTPPGSPFSAQPWQEQTL
jgi:hypothetical protein